MTRSVELPHVLRMMALGIERHKVYNFPMWPVLNGLAVEKKMNASLILKALYQFVPLTLSITLSYRWLPFNKKSLQ
jgi:hypothetical protein